MLRLATFVYPSHKSHKQVDTKSLRDTMRLPATAALASFAVGSVSKLLSKLPLDIETRASINSRLTNIHIERRGDSVEAARFTYGPCKSASLVHGTHVDISTTTSTSHDRLV